MEHLKIEIIFQSFSTVILSGDQSKVLEGSENLPQSLISVQLFFLQPVPSAEFLYKIVSNGGSKIVFYLIKQVDELLFTDSVLELPRLSHPKKDRFNLLGSVWANKGYARYWTGMSTRI